MTTALSKITLPSVLRDCSCSSACVRGANSMETRKSRLGLPLFVSAKEVSSKQVWRTVSLVLCVLACLSVLVLSVLPHRVVKTTTSRSPVTTSTAFVERQLPVQHTLIDNTDPSNALLTPVHLIKFKDLSLKEELDAPTLEPSAEPTAEPSAEPTAAPTDEPSAYPTAAPSPVPTAEPTPAPSRPTATPTAQPSMQPSIRPTSAPSERPTRVPTRIPTALPTARPSARPTPLPGKPTAAPTRATAQPTSQPSADPYPAETALTFSADVTLVGITSAAFLADTAATTALVAAFASTMPRVEEQHVSILSVVDVARRRRLRAQEAGTAEQTSKQTGHANTAVVTFGHEQRVNVSEDTHLISESAVQSKRFGRSAPHGASTTNGTSSDTGRQQYSASKVLAAGVEVTLQVQIILEHFGFTGDDGATVYDTLSDSASTAVSDGSFVGALDSKLLDVASDTILNVNAAAFEVGPFSTAVSKTPRPTAGPTAMPSVSPTVTSNVATTTTGGGNDSAVVTIIVIVSVIGSIALLVSLMIGAYYETEVKKRQKIGPEPMLAVVPGEAQS